eukprot:scaffold26287_cov69-Phaeocystis_antarctica.AAC.3
MAIQAGVATCELKRGLAARSLRNAPGETLSPSVPRRRLGGGGGGGRAGDSLWQHPPHSHWISEPISQDCAWQGVASVTGAECGTPPGVRGRGQRAERERAEGREQRAELLPRQTSSRCTGGASRGCSTRRAVASWVAGEDSVTVTAVAAVAATAVAAMAAVATVVAGPLAAAASAADPVEA